MPGKRITSQQVAIYIDNRNARKTQVTAAAKAGMSERSGRRIEKNMTLHKLERTHRTRKDPFEGVFESIIVPLLKKGVYQATFLLKELQNSSASGTYPKSLLRTLQRQVKHWKALYGKDKAVMFKQIHEPGKLGLSDFTHPKLIKVTILGKAFEHIFYHFRLPYSGFSHLSVFKGSGESYTKFAQGLQEALHYIGGAPGEHRTDSLSAAFKNLKKKASEDLTARYEALNDHYGMLGYRINKGQSHENGAVESPHRHIKDRLLQSLLVRGNADFDSLEEYRDFVKEVVREHNLHTAASARLEIERPSLKRLPSTKAIEYADATAVVSTSSTIDVRRVTYSVPSKLIGAKLLVRIYNEKLECYVGSSHVLTLERASIPEKGTRGRKIDYRHLIPALKGKPGAFRGFIFRDDLLPNDNYRFIWKYVDRKMGPIDASNLWLAYYL